MLGETPSIPEIPGDWKTCSVIIKSPTVWNDHSAMRAGVDAGVVVDVSTYPDGNQKFTIVPTERYDKACFPAVLEEITTGALEVDVSFE